MRYDFDDHEFDEEVRELCRMALAAEREDELQDIFIELRIALRKHMNRVRALVAGHFLGDELHPRGNDPAENNARMQSATQPPSGPESDSATGFISWVRLKNPKPRQKPSDPQ